MRVIVDVVTSVTNSIRFIAAMFVLCMLGFGLMITAGTSYVAPKAADSIERMSDKAIEAAQIEARNAQMSQEGWGYSNEPIPTDSTVPVDPYPGQFGEDNGGWAE
ncbi:MAG: hypothetical protein AAF687_02055 [Pseudomonadota bacterium]